MNFRNVKFTLEKPGVAVGDYDDMPQNDVEEITKERDGYFHLFGNVPFYDATTNSFHDRIMAIVEEKTTGKIYNIYPEKLTFKD